MPDFRVLVLCVGNVCRSPVVERLLAARLAEHGVGDRVEVSSAGISAMEGSGMHPTSARGVAAYGGSADGFVARQVTDPMLLRADLVLTATRAVRARVLADVPSAVRRAFTVLELADLVPRASRRGRTGPAELVATCADERAALREGAGTDAHEMPDPVGRDDEVFDEVARLADQATRTIAAALAASLRVAGG